MKESTIITGYKNKMTSYVREFNSLTEFYDYITNTPLNASWANGTSQSSVTGSKSFTKTDSFDEATKLFKEGWSEEAAKLTKKFEAKKKDSLITNKARPSYSVQGFQCSVPRYLQGLPDSMINKKNVPVKQKVVTLTKSISYGAWCSVEKIEDESIKALMIVQKLEAQGIRCNVNIIFSSERKHREVCKIRIKSASERLNIAKQAFPLVHPSMLRRLLFRYVEVAPTVTSDFTYGYGKPTDDATVKTIVKKLNNDNEFFIPAFVNTDINTIQDLQNIN